MKISTWLLNIHFHLRLFLLLILVAIDAESCQRSFPNFNAQPFAFDWDLSRLSRCPLLGQVVLAHDSIKFVLALSTSQRAGPLILESNPSIVFSTTYDQQSRGSNLDSNLTLHLDQRVAVSEQLWCTNLRRCKYYICSGISE